MPATSRVLVDGRLTPADRAVVSVFDRGFQYGDALIETLRVARGDAIAAEAHLQRLQRSANLLGFPLPERDWRSDIGRLIDVNELSAVEAWARITLTRGTSARGLLPPAAAAARCIVAVGPLDPSISRLRRDGLHAHILGFGRGAALAEHKHAFYLPSIEGRRQAALRGCDDGLFVGPGGAVEGATSANLFAVIDGVLVTPRGGGVLPGVTRARAWAAARARGLRVVARRLPRSQLLGAGEAFLTNALFEVVPLVRIDDAPVGRGRPGALTRALQEDLLNGATRRRIR